VIQILPQGRFLGAIAIVPPNGQPGIVIQAAAGPGGPAPEPGVPALLVNPVLPVRAPIGPTLPAPVDTLAGIQSHGRNTIIITEPDHGYQWENYFSKENCPPMIRQLEMAM
jgi:hypothetical protein